MIRATLRCLGALLIAGALAVLAVLVAWLLGRLFDLPALPLLVGLGALYALVRVWRGLGEELSFERRMHWWWWK